MTDQSTAHVFLDRLYDAFNRGDLDALDDLIADDYVEYADDVHGPAAFKAHFAVFLRAFPDLRITIDDVLAVGDRFASRTTMTGTHTGELMGIPATGRSVRVSAVDLGRIEGGKARERWGGLDVFSLLQQLGVMGQPTS